MRAYDYSYDHNDFVSCTVLHSKQRKARKDHVCSFCNKPILAGTTYIHEAQIYDGDFQFVKYHYRYCWNEE